jgi:CheY-like chemotaxis protein
MNTNLLIALANANVEEHPVLTEIIKEISPTHSVISFYDGQSLMDFLEKQGTSENHHSGRFPDIIVLDLNIPRIDGYETLRRIKGRSKLKHIDVFILTNSIYEYDRIKSIAYGCTDFYSKPDDSNELVKIMQDIFSQVKSPSFTTAVLSE